MKNAELVNGIRGSRLELINRDHQFIPERAEVMIRPALTFLAEVDRNSVGRLKHYTTRWASQESPVDSADIGKEAGNTRGENQDTCR